MSERKRLPGRTHLSTVQGLGVSMVSWFDVHNVSLSIHEATAPVYSGRGEAFVPDYLHVVFQWAGPPPDRPDQFTRWAILSARLEGPRLLASGQASVSVRREAKWQASTPSYKPLPVDDEVLAELPQPYRQIVAALFPTWTVGTVFDRGARS